MKYKLSFIFKPNYNLLKPVLISGGGGGGG